MLLAAEGTGLRRSDRVRKRAGSTAASDSLVHATDPATSSVKPTTKKNTKRGKATTTSKTTTTTTKKKKRTPTQAKVAVDDEAPCLPRTREQYLRRKHRDDTDDASPLLVLGVDEAGRGPLAGPVVAAACWCPTNIPGITDSKKITSEAERERLYDLLVRSPGVRWAAAVIDAPRIDDVNILQATLEGMRHAVRAVVGDVVDDQITVVAEADCALQGCYVVSSSSRDDSENDNSYHALVDGNRIPSDLPCPAEFIIKGDSKEYAIAAASVIAKVTRDRLMHGYHALYPAYELARHKGYPTKAHMAAVHQHGASPIHRRTFAPLKHMEFDEQGGVVR